MSPSRSPRLNEYPSMLSKFATYKISKKSLAKFKKQGFSEESINNLADLEERYFPSVEVFLSHLKKLPNSSEIMEKENVILKHSRGYFRMDGWITHKATREWLEALIFAVVVALIVRTFLFAPFRIPSGSMIPAIQIGDQIFATMFTYGIPVPFTDAKLFPQSIERGDIIIFPAPPDSSIDFIKRAIALEGETVEIVRDKVYINGKLLEEPYAFFDPDNRTASQYPNVSNFGPVTVPQGHLLAMGDNRYNSHDGRFWGFVALKKIKGKGQMVYWSKDHREGLLGFFDWESYRFGRILHFLE